MFVENKTTEFKREYVEDIKNTIVAFANCEGGTLYIGVQDDGEVCGVDNVDGTMLRVTNAIRDAVRPDITMFVECRNDIIDEKSIVCNCPAWNSKTVLSAWKRNSARGCLCPPGSINSSGYRCRHPEYD